MCLQVINNAINHITHKDRKKRKQITLLSE